MRAVQITALTGPEAALRLDDLSEPAADHELTPGHGVVIDVRAAGVSFPEVLQTRGKYRVQPLGNDRRGATGKVVLDLDGAAGA